MGELFDAASSALLPELQRERGFDPFSYVFFVRGSHTTQSHRCLIGPSLASGGASAA